MNTPFFMIKRQTFKRVHSFTVQAMIDIQNVIIQSLDLLILIMSDDKGEVVELIRHYL